MELEEGNEKGWKKARKYSCVYTGFWGTITAVLGSGLL